MNRKAPDGHAGKRLRQIREHRGISQGRIAKAIGVSVGTIQNYERGRVSFTTDRLKQLARVLQCEPAELLQSPGEPPPRYLYRSKSGWPPVLAFLSVFAQPMAFDQDDNMDDRVAIREVINKAARVTMTKYNNFPLKECDAALRKLMPTLPVGSAFFQKWTCGGCGARVTGNTPNKLFIAGICEDCGHTTDITKTGCNYSIHTAVGGIASMKAKGSA